jgi:hypothetical protein
MHHLFALCIVLCLVGRGGGMPKIPAHSIDVAFSRKCGFISNEILHLSETRPACVLKSRGRDFNLLALRGGRGDPDERKEVGCFNPFLACFLVSACFAIGDITMHICGLNMSHTLHFMEQNISNTFLVTYANIAWYYSCKQSGKARTLLQTCFVLAPRPQPCSL